MQMHASQFENRNYKIDDEDSLKAQEVILRLRGIARTPRQEVMLVSARKFRVYRRVFRLLDIALQLLVEEQMIDDDQHTHGDELVMNRLQSLQEQLGDMEEYREQRMKELAARGDD